VVGDRDRLGTTCVVGLVIESVGMECDLSEVGVWL
jgi:hypothetical protein